MRAGYKRTEVGVIPEDWAVSSVGTEFAVQLGKMIDAARNVGVEKPYLGNRAVQWGSIDISNLPTVPMSASDLNKFRLEKNDLLVCEGGEVGRAAIWEAPIEECYYQKALHRMRPKRGYDPRLMVAVLQSWSQSCVLSNHVTQTSIAHLPREKLITLPLACPPQSEQRAIAEALSDVDALLTGLDRLIAKKRDLKQAAMQQLLTGQTRLPGIGGKWQTRPLPSIVQVASGQVDPRNEPYRSMVLVAPDHVESGTGRLLTRKTAGEQHAISGKYVVNRGDIVYSKIRPYLRKAILAPPCQYE